MSVKSSCLSLTAMLDESVAPLPTSHNKAHLLRGADNRAYAEVEPAPAASGFSTFARLPTDLRISTRAEPWSEGCQGAVRRVGAEHYMNELRPLFLWSLRSGAWDNAQLKAFAQSTRPGSWTSHQPHNGSSRLPCRAY